MSMFSVGVRVGFSVLGGSEEVLWWKYKFYWDLIFFILLDYNYFLE